MTVIIGVCPDCRQMRNACRCPKIKPPMALDALSLQAQMREALRVIEVMKEAMEMGTRHMKKLEAISQAAEDFVVAFDKGNYKRELVVLKELLEQMEKAD